MTATIAATSHMQELQLNQPLLEQVTAKIGVSAAYLAGKNAYDYLDHVRGLSAVQIQTTLSLLGLGSIRGRDLHDQGDAALAVAAAALLDGSKGRRVTGAEQIDLALDLIDEKLAGGW